MGPGVEEGDNEPVDVVGQLGKHAEKHLHGEIEGETQRLGQLRVPHCDENDARLCEKWEEGGGGKKEGSRREKEGKGGKRREEGETKERRGRKIRGK